MGESRPINLCVECRPRPLQMLMVWELRVCFTAEETETVIRPYKFAEHILQNLGS